MTSYYITFMFKLLKYNFYFIHYIKKRKRKIRKNKKK